MSLIRIQTPEGQLRINISSKSSKQLYKLTFEKFNKPEKSFRLYTQRPANKNFMIKDNVNINLSHGQQIYLFYTNTSNISDSCSGDNVTIPSVALKNQIEEAQIDQKLWQIDTHAFHGDVLNKTKTITVNNMKSNPWDPEVLQARETKWMSFHSFMRMKRNGADGGKFTKLNHENLSLSRSKSNKYTSSDLPSSITLTQQNFRHVDQITFENRDIAQQFLNFWLKNNAQRIGFCYGKYEIADQGKFPLGITAKIMCIYEPPQKNFTNKIDFSNDNDIEQMNKVHNLATKMGLERIGWIFSDLLAAENSLVKNLRNKDTHLITAQEILTAASFQLQHPNTCRMSDNFYGSKFVTLIATGDENKQISFNGYQASNQCMDLVKSEIIIPTLDAPELAYVKESDEETFIPDIYYKYIDEYNNELKKLARPMPVEYLLIDMTVTMPFEDKFEYSWSKRDSLPSFPIENRPSEPQSLSAFSKYLKHFCGPGLSQGMLINKFDEIFKNFHLLVWMILEEDMIGCGQDGSFKVVDILNFDKNEKFVKIEAIKNLVESANWQTLLEICREQSSFDNNLPEDLTDDISEAIKRSLQER